jgi:molybdopterin converting factor small subunit
LIVEVKVFATLTSYLPPRDRATGMTTLDVPVGATVNDVAVQLGIPDVIARVALVNGQDAGPERHLSAGDVVTLFPPLMGGV